MASACTAGIVGKHPFVDGNKRTGFVVGVLFLELNGFRFTATEEDAPRLFCNWRPVRLMSRATWLSFERTPQRNEFAGNKRLLRFNRSFYSIGRRFSYWLIGVVTLILFA